MQKTPEFDASYDPIVNESNTMNRNAWLDLKTWILAILEFQIFFWLKFIQRYPTFIG